MECLQLLVKADVGFIYVKIGKAHCVCIGEKERLSSCQLFFASPFRSGMAGSWLPWPFGQVSGASHFSVTCQETPYKACCRLSLAPRYITAQCTIHRIHSSHLPRAPAHSFTGTTRVIEGQSGQTGTRYFAAWGGATNGIPPHTYTNRSRCVVGQGQSSCGGSWGRKPHKGLFPSLAVNI